MSELNRVHKIFAEWTGEIVAEREQLKAKIEALETKLENEGRGLDSESKDWDSIGVISQLERKLDKVENNLVEIGSVAQRLPPNVEEVKSGEPETWLQSIEHIEANKEELGQQAELYRMAGKEARKRLGALFTYIDGGIDQPLLTPENVLHE